MPKIEEQDDMCGHPAVPHLMLQRVIEKEALAFAPTANLVTDPNFAIGVRNQAEMATNLIIPGAAVGQDVSAGTQRGKLGDARQRIAPLGQRREQLRGLRAKLTIFIKAKITMVKIERVPHPIVDLLFFLVKRLRVFRELGITAQGQKLAANRLKSGFEGVGPRNFASLVKWFARNSRIKVITGCHIENVASRPFIDLRTSVQALDAVEQCLGSLLEGIGIGKALEKPVYLCAKFGGKRSHFFALSAAKNRVPGLARPCKYSGEPEPSIFRITVSEVKVANDPVAQDATVCRSSLSAKATCLISDVFNERVVKNTATHAARLYAVTVSIRLHSYLW